MRPSLVIALGLVLTLPLAARALPEDTWVVSIGHNAGARDEVDLLYAEQDARALADALREHSGISSRRTLLLLGEDATSVRRALQDVNAQIRARTGEGKHTALVVFYSGHADANALHLGGTELPLEELKTLVEGAAAGIRLLVIDACRSGSVTRVKGVKAAESFRIDLQDGLATEGLAIITSSAAGESSQESDRLQGSFFTHHLVNALRGAADSDDDGKVTLGEAYRYTYSQTLRSSGQTVALQHPTYSWDVKGRGELVLSAPADLRGRAGRLRLAEPAIYLIMAERAGGPVVAEVSPQGNRRELSLRAGKYFIQQRSPSEFREYQVEVATGSLVELAALSFETVRYDRLVRRRGAPSEHVHNLTLLAGGRGQALSGQGTTPHLLLGWGMDFDWGSPSLRLRGMTARASSVDGLLPRRDSELGLGVVLQRFIDLRHLSFAFGLSVEGVRHHQAFDTQRSVADRSSWGATFGGVLAVERHLGAGFALRLEGGPETALFQHAVVEQGVEVGTELATPLTWRAAGGLVWRR
jgi:hypothetical protein